MENSKNSSLSKLVPVMLCFFAMGFVDLVGIASNYVKADLGLSDSQANICLQLRKGGSWSVGLTGEYLSVISILLVFDILCTYRYADEPHWSEENRIA